MLSIFTGSSNVITRSPLSMSRSKELIVGGVTSAINSAVWIPLSSVTARISTPRMSLKAAACMVRKVLDMAVATFGFSFKLLRSVLVKFNITMVPFCDDTTTPSISTRLTAVGASWISILFVL